MTRLDLTKAARRDLAALPEPLRPAVAETIDRLGIDPRSVGKPLVGRMGGLWSARVGNYRVLYTIEGSPASLRVVVREVTHRALAYRRRRQK